MIRLLSWIDAIIELISSIVGLIIVSVVAVAVFSVVWIAVSNNTEGLVKRQAWTEVELNHKKTAWSVANSLATTTALFYRGIKVDPNDLDLYRGLGNSPTSIEFKRSAFERLYKLTPPPYDDSYNVASLTWELLHQ